MEQIGGRRVVDIPNPLLISLVINNVFKYQNLETVKQCRLVCKEWQEVAVPWFKKLSICAPHTICSKLPVYEQYFGPAAFYNDFFTHDVIDSMPLQNIYFSDKVEENRIPIRYPLIFNWLKKHGSKLTGIRYILRRCKKESNFFEWIVTKYCPNLEELEIRRALPYVDFALKDTELPKLKRLTLSIVDDTSQLSIKLSKIPGSRIPQILTLFKAMPNLEYVEVFVPNSWYSNCVAAALQIYGKNLKHLVWKNVIYDRDFRFLGDLPEETKLQTLDLDCLLFTVASTADDLFDFFDNQSKSLEVLKIKGEVVETWGTDDDADDNSEEDDVYSYLLSSGDEVEESESESDDDPEGPAPVPIEVDQHNLLPYIILNIPNLPKLKVLEINDIFHCRLGTLYSFMQDVPNLKKLSLKNVTYASDVRPVRPDDLLTELLFPRTGVIYHVHDKLEEFYLDGQIRDPSCISAIAKYFPKLKKVDLFVDSNPVFFEVFARFNSIDIDELSLRFSGISDTTWCESIFVVHLPKMSALRRLTLRFLPTYPCQLTEKAVAEGFSKAESLRWLTLQNFSVCVTEQDSILGHLEHMVCVTFSECSLRGPLFNAMYSRYSDPVRMPIMFTPQ